VSPPATPSEGRSTLGPVLLLVGVALSLAGVAWLIVQMRAETDWDRVLGAAALWAGGSVSLARGALLIRRSNGPPS